MSRAESAAPGSTASRVGTAGRVGGAFLASELSVLFRRRRTWAMLVVLAAVPILIAIAVRVTSTSAPGRGPQFLDRITQNGLFVGITALIVSIPLFLPLTVGVVAGDTIAGEAAHGTLRYLLIAPIGRVRLLVVKYLGSAAFCVAATLAVVAAGTISGLALFPVGPVTLLSGATIGVGESILRLLAIAAFVTVSLLGLCAIGLFVSTLTDVPVGAMAGTVVLSVVSQVADQIPQLEWVHPCCSATTGSRSPTCCGSRSPGNRSATTRCCSSAMWSCSVRLPTAVSPPKMCSPNRRTLARDAVAA